MSYIGFTLISGGVFFIITGIIGIIKFRDFYTKIHATSVIEITGVCSCLLGLSFLQTDIGSASKLVLIIILVLLLSPAANHAIARASLKDKIDHTGRIK